MKMRRVLLLLVVITVLLTAVPAVPAESYPVSVRTYVYQWSYPTWWQTIRISPPPSQPAVPQTQQPVQPPAPSSPTAPPASPPANDTTQPPQPPQSSTGTVTSSTYQLSAFEQKVVDLVNVERAKNGLSPLRQYWELSRVARFKSEDLRDSNYFDHQSPTYGSPFVMIKNFGLTYRYAGENIAAGQATPEAVMQAWLNSPGHRANILNPNFTHIGVGYAAGGAYRHYWTQMFIGR